MGVPRIAQQWPLRQPPTPQRKIQTKYNLHVHDSYQLCVLHPFGSCSEVSEVIPRFYPEQVWAQALDLSVLPKWWAGVLGERWGPSSCPGSAKWPQQKSWVRKSCLKVKNTNAAIISGSGQPIGWTGDFSHAWPSKSQQFLSCLVTLPQLFGLNNPQGGRRGRPGVGQLRSEGASCTCALCVSDTNVLPSSFWKYNITKQSNSGTTSSTSETKWPFRPVRKATERLWAVSPLQIDAEEDARLDWNLGSIQRKS